MLVLQCVGKDSRLVSPRTMAFFYKEKEVNLADYEEYQDALKKMGRTQREVYIHNRVRS